MASYNSEHILPGTCPPRHRTPVGPSYLDFNGFCDEANNVCQAFPRGVVAALNSVATAFAAAAAPGRGLHSSTSHLNLRRI
jgi:hypothetical protein